MIGLEDHQSLSQEIGVAHAAGALLHLACEIAGIDLRTLQRWKAHEGLTAGDGRPQAARPEPSHALSEVERAELVRVANEPRFAAVPPARIVPMLADDGVYLASESTFSRVLRDEGQAAHRGRAKQPRAVRPPQWKTHEEVRAHSCELFDRWLSAPERVRFPGGESLQDLFGRTADALRQLIDDHLLETIVLVGHDSVNRAVLLQVLQQSPSTYWRLVQSPCGISEIDIDHQRTRVVRMNETAHVEGLTR